MVFLNVVVVAMVQLYLLGLIDAHKAIKQLQTQRSISNNDGTVQENKRCVIK